MGREAEAHGRWAGQEGWTKAILESAEIILRGDIQARLPRAGLSDWRVDGDTLLVRSAGDLLELGLGADEAGRWVAALDKPLPTLAQKLGVSATCQAYLTGCPKIAELNAALLGGATADLEKAGVIIAVLQNELGVERALTLGRARPDLAIWCIHGKGKSAAVTDAGLRSIMRGAGYMDVKTSAVSADWTGTRYKRRVD
jgi:hypothetical protein